MDYQNARDPKGSKVSVSKIIEVGPTIKVL